MAFYKTCPYCGAHLDPGEKCDCQEENEQPGEKRIRIVRREEMMRLKLDEEISLEKVAV